ncbi:MAG: hypothetical protein ACNA75_10075, partial [Thiohalomonadaceae bacterium]
SGSSRSNGQLSLRAAVTNATTPTTATVSYWNPYDYSYSSAQVEVGAGCTANTVRVEKPRQCHVTGTVTSGDSPAANEYVWAHSSNPYAYGWAYTNAEGQFNTRVRCDVDMDLYLGNNEVGSFRVDGIQAGNEVTDDGSVANMGTITKVNTPPYAYGYLSSYSVRVGSLGTADVTAYVYGWDADGDYPLSYEVSYGVSDETPTVLASGSISQNDGFISTSLSGLSEGSYDLSLEVTDGADATTTVALGNLEVVSGNRPPVISYAYTSVGSSVRLNKDGSLPNINLYAHSYDPDGDALIRGWTCTGCLQALAANLNNDVFDGAGDYSAVNSLTFTYTTTDTTTDADGASVSRDRVVDILPAVNNTPRILNSSPSEIILAEVPAQVTLKVDVSDNDGDLLTVRWWTGDELLQTDTLPGNGVSEYLVDVTANAQEGDFEVFTVEVTDGIATIFRDFTVRYQPASSDTTIIVQ